MMLSWSAVDDVLGIQTETAGKLIGLGILQSSRSPPASG
jgi:hypothetical protein